MKIKGNQVFKTLDFLTLVFGFLAVGAVAGPMISDAFRGNEQAKVQVESETLAKKLLRADWVNSVNTASLPVNAGRSPASMAGSMSLNHRDPWGYPYHYKLAKGPDGNSNFILVWSAGPDHVSDSDSVDVKFDGVGKPVAVFVNDDEGSVVSAR